MAAVELYDNANFNDGAMYATDISQPDLGGAARRTNAFVHPIPQEKIVYVDESPDG